MYFLRWLLFTLHVGNRYSLLGEENLVHLGIHQEELAYNLYICKAEHLACIKLNIILDRYCTSHDQIYFINILMVK